MKKLERYTGDKVYMFPNGSLGTREAVLQQFPAAESFTFVVTTDSSGEVMLGMDNLSLLRDVYNIAPELTEDEAIAAIQEIVNTEPEPVEDVPTAEERIAAALEYQVMASLPDEETSDTIVTESEGTE